MSGRFHCSIASSLWARLHSTCLRDAFGITPTRLRYQFCKPFKMSKLIKTENPQNHINKTMNAWRFIVLYCLFANSRLIFRQFPFNFSPIPALLFANSRFIIRQTFAKTSQTYAKSSQPPLLNPHKTRTKPAQKPRKNLAKTSLLLFLCHSHTFTTQIRTFVCVKGGDFRVISE